MFSKKDKDMDSMKNMAKGAAARGDAFYSREYKTFKEEKREAAEQQTLYERCCNRAEKLLRIRPDRETTEKLGEAIRFCELRVTPSGAVSLAVIVIAALAGASVALAAAGIFPLYAAILGLIISVAAGYYVLQIPKNMAIARRIQASSEIMLAVLYMVVSMRATPNLESAVRFAAVNTTGPLSYDLRKILWDLEMRRYSSVNEALVDYISKWKDENEEFAEAVYLIMNSMDQSERRGEAMLDEAINVILDGSRERMKHYAQDMRTPVMVLSVMGIMLPIMGMIIFPMVSIFMTESVSPLHLVAGYDVALPLFIWWMMSKSLEKRPMTLSQVDISNHPDMVPKGRVRMRLGRRDVLLPVLPVALIVAVIISGSGALYFAQQPALNTLGSVAMSFLMVFGVALGIALYWVGTTFQNRRVQNGVSATELEFKEGLFQLGNRTSGGTPIEVALENVAYDLRKLKIAGLFEISLKNIRTLGMTFEQSMFDEDYGALKYYPSRLITSIMRVLAETSKKGMRVASLGAMSISRYMKGIHQTQEDIGDMLGETTSTLSFQGHFLAPAICGIVVATGQIIMQVLLFLGKKMDELETIKGIVGNPVGAIVNLKAATPPELLQLIVGVYLLELLIIIGAFVTKVSRGENAIEQRFSTGRMIIIGMVVYIAVLLTVGSVFGGLISASVGLISGV